MLFNEPFEDVELSAILQLALLPSPSTLQGQKHLLLAYLLIFPASTFPGPMTSTTYHSKNNGTEQSIDCVEPGDLNETNPSVSAWEKTG